MSDEAPPVEMSPHLGDDEQKAAVGPQRVMCDHICLLDEGHVERGELHFYGYEIPSPRADPNEPRFVLLARDVLASDLVYEWARRREVLARIGQPTEDELRKIAEARACADAMRDWHGLKHAAPVENRGTET